MFASVDDLADLLGEELTGSRLAQAALSLEIASAQIQGWTRQRLERVVNDVVVLRGTTGWELELPERPVVAVGAITIDEVPVSASSYNVAGPVIVRSLGWSGPTASVSVTYTHGYDPIPDDIRVATLQLAMGGFTNPQGIRQESVGTYSVTYEAGGGDSTAPILQSLNRYRRRVGSTSIAGTNWYYGGIYVANA